MRPGFNAIEAVAVFEKCNGLLIREDHPGLTQLGPAAQVRSDNNFLDRLALPRPAGQFILCVSMCMDGRQLHAIVDLSRRLGYLC